MMQRAGFKTNFVKTDKLIPEDVYLPVHDTLSKESEGTLSNESEGTLKNGSEGTPKDVSEGTLNNSLALASQQLLSASQISTTSNTDLDVLVMPKELSDIHKMLEFSNCQNNLEF